MLFLVGGFLSRHFVVSNFFMPYILVGIVFVLQKYVKEF